MTQFEKLLAVIEEVKEEEEVVIKKPTDEEIPESWEDFSSDEE